ncbi:unnamed protein product [Rhodiola kirilowii]
MNHPPPELGLFDFDYEFNAPRYFDFTFPESQSDVDEAESWFRTATSYPPSPFVLEMMWNEDLHAAHSQASCMFEQVPSSSSISIVSNTTGCLSAQDDRKNGMARNLNLLSGMRLNFLSCFMAERLPVCHTIIMYMIL